MMKFEKGVKTNYGKKGKFYSKKNLDKTGALYRMCFGERANGKSFQVLQDFLIDYIEHGWQGAYVRRWVEDIRPKTMKSLFMNFEANEIAGNLIEKYSHGDYNSYIYRGRDFYLVKKSENGEIEKEDMNSFCHTFALTDWEHEKAVQFPKVKKILFDEFLTRTHYIPDEYSAFNNVLSTIIRRRDDVIIYMIGNTVTKACPYFDEMGLKHVRDQRQGTIDVYTFTDELKVAVEFCEDTSQSKASNKYFAFDNPAVKMITTGTWQTDIYPHLPIKYNRDLIQMLYFINYQNVILQCEIMTDEQSIFTFIHEKTGPVKNETDILFQSDVDNNPYHYTDMTRPVNTITRKIWDIFNRYPVFYQSNDIGEIMRNYLISCSSK